MSGSRTLLHLLTKATIGLGALFLVGVLLAAIPNHRLPAVASVAGDRAQEAQAPAPAVPSGMEGMPGMDPDDARAGEHTAMQDMAHMHHGNSAHMRMTSTRPTSKADQQRAAEITEQLRAGIEKYKDYQVALDEGYKIFMPNIPQPEYHFTNYRNGFMEAISFDPSRPTSLLYRKTETGYELIGAMYTMPKRASEAELDERVPLSVAPWHLHTNLCLPPKGSMRKADWTKFGLKGSITTEEGCDAAGGRFSPVIFGWMVHVYPYESTQDKVFAMHHHD